MEMTEAIETTDEVFESLNLCDGCLTVPLVVLALSIDTPIGGWDLMLEQASIKQVTDHIGRKAISAAAARRLLNTVRRRAQLVVEDHDRRSKELAKKHPVRAGGITRPAEADPSMSAIEVMLAADADKPDPNKRPSPMTEFLEGNFGKPRKVEGKRENR